MKSITKAETEGYFALSYVWNCQQEQNLIPEQYESILKENAAASGLPKDRLVKSLGANSLFPDQIMMPDKGYHRGRYFCSGRGKSRRDFTNSQGDT